MKYHIVKKPRYSDNPDYTLTITASGLLFKRCDRQILFSETQIAQSWIGGLALLYSPTHGFIVTENDRIIDDPGHLPYLQNVLHAEPGYVASIVPNEDGTECVAVLYCAVAYDGNFDLSEGNAQTATVVGNYFPEYEQRRLSWRDAKSALVKSISPLDCIGDVEKQIDLLSLLVIALAEKQPEDERPQWLAQFKAVIEQGTSLQFKGPAKAIEDIAERKAALRALQEHYFKTKNGGHDGAI